MPEVVSSKRRAARFVYRLFLFVQLQAFALDQSRDAVDLTRENAFRLGLLDRLQIHHLDIMKDAKTILSICGHVSAVVSNPPYLFSGDLMSLEPEIRFEDHAALDGGEDGLKVIKTILTLAPRILLNHGLGSLAAHTLTHTPTWV